MELAVSHAFVVNGPGGEPSPHSSLTEQSIELHTTGVLCARSQLINLSLFAVLGRGASHQLSTNLSIFSSKSAVSVASTSSSVQGALQI